MKDIPLFSTENGVATLSLQQIPYSGFAHITIHSTSDFFAFIQECVEFCRAVGAERIVACGHDKLLKYPVYTRILRMQMPAVNDPSAACLFPVTENTLDEWLHIYNNGMKDVSNATLLSKRMGKAFLEQKSAYFVHDNGILLGIGAVEGDSILAVVACVKGAGERVMRALCGVVCGDTVMVEVAENNIAALGLYLRMGFVSTGVLKTWYDVSKNILDVK